MKDEMPDFGIVDTTIQCLLVFGISHRGNAGKTKSCHKPFRAIAALVIICLCVYPETIVSKGDG